MNVPALLLHGADDHTAPLGDVQGLMQAAVRVGVPIRLQVVEGDHHLAVRCPEVVAAAIELIRPAE